MIKFNYYLIDRLITSNYNESFLSLLHLEECRLWCLVKIDSDGENMWNSVGLSGVVQGVSTVGAFSSNVGGSLGEVLLKDVVQPELILWDATFTTLVEDVIDRPGLDHGVWARVATDIIGSHSRAQKSCKSECFHFDLNLFY